jgi:hypothetical protein
LLASVFLSEGWAEPVDDPRPTRAIPLNEFQRDPTKPNPPNLVREFYPPYFDSSPALAADRRRRVRSRFKPKL